MKNKSIVSEGREIALAVNLIQLGARLQLLEAETHLSRERLLKLYKEVKGVSLYSEFIEQIELDTKSEIAPKAAAMVKGVPAAERLVRTRRFQRALLGSQCADGRA